MVGWDGRRRIRVLVVDDSLVFREVLMRGISTDPAIEVVGVAKDPYEARDKILQYRPDVLTCDIEMPLMNGIEFIRRLLPQYPLPIIAVSSLSESALEALKAGAVEFVAKPNFMTPGKVEAFLHDLIDVIKAAAHAKVVTGTADRRQRRGEFIHVPAEDSDRVIVIGASTGGTEAIHSVLGGMPADTPGIVVVQHIPPVFSRMFADRLNHACALRVSEAKDGDLVDQGTVLIAPGDRHVKLVKAGKRFKVECRSGEKVSGHCPSVDVLFESAAKAAGDRAIGVLLTGMGQDGARGLLAMRNNGARTIAQDEQSSVVYGMPKAAYDLGAVEVRAALSEIPRVIGAMWT
ncbi:chemotaxis response regulator protein-glutamate methylesterase [Cohnella endophytica]|uniref:Protein-glutamate methylesterase/protein-glutamine glutaminase n=1 Tax=Cohnella endophytica TaxID=2419778 RepID=A0A494X9G3_9BACL|nr:chemotaxis response regulator protein-glutamate methylesterase [Cohnella endophytica]RKP47355.1 chemotaxis response regulator protein-glutamate methylesterase [Cohnella endophytica]